MSEIIRRWPQISGIVSKNGKPLEDVEIIIENYDLPISKTKSNADGNFSITLNLQTEYLLHFIKKGFLKNSILISTKTASIKKNHKQQRSTKIMIDHMDEKSRICEQGQR